MLYKINSKNKEIFNRDFIYKAGTQNVHSIIHLSKMIVVQRVPISECVETMSAFVLLLDWLPVIRKPKKNKTNKPVISFVNIKKTLAITDFSEFFYRCKNDKNISFSQNIENSLGAVTFVVKPILFDEFLELYEYFSKVSSLYIHCFMKNCKNEEEKKLLLSGFLRL